MIEPEEDLNDFDPDSADESIGVIEEDEDCGVEED